MIHLKDTVSLLTGAAGGLGYASARKLSELGAKVVIADIDESERAQQQRLW